MVFSVRPTLHICIQKPCFVPSFFVCVHVCVITTRSQALFLISLQEVSLLHDAALLTETVTVHCWKFSGSWCLFRATLCHHALCGPSSLTAQLMPSQQVSYKSYRYFSTFSHIDRFCFVLLAVSISEEVLLLHTSHCTLWDVALEYAIHCRMCGNLKILIHHKVESVI